MQVRQPIQRSINARLSCVGFALTLSLFAGGCFIGKPIGRSAGKEALKSIKSQDSVLVALERRLADSATVFMKEALKTAALDPARAQADSIAAIVRGAADSVATRLAIQMRSDLNESAKYFLDENLDLLDRRTTAIARNVARSLIDELERDLPGAFATVGDTLGKRLIAGLTVGLRETLDPELHKIMVEVTDSLRIRIRQVDQTVAESETLGGLRYALLGASLVMALVLIVVALGYWKRQRKALHALIDAIEARGDPAMHEKVQTCASEAGVHGWLNDQVAKRRKPDDSPPDAH